MTQFALILLASKIPSPLSRTVGSQLRGDSILAFGLNILPANWVALNTLFLETGGSTCNRNRLCAVRTLLMSTSVPSSEEAGPAVFVHSDS